MFKSDWLVQITFLLYLNYKITKYIMSQHLFNKLLKINLKNFPKRTATENNILIQNCK